MSIFWTFESGNPGHRDFEPRGEGDRVLTLRVIQWGTGNVGRLALQAIVKRPDLELVGGYAYSADKVGKDLGRLSGMDDIGVTATGSIDALLSAGADCVVYMPSQPNLAELERLLGAGLNVVSTAGFLTGSALGPDFGRRIDAAGKRGGVSCYGTGVNPGYLNQLCLMLTSACREVHSIVYRETADCSTYAAPEMWRVLGFGSPPTPGASMSSSAEQLTNQFFDAIDMMATGLGVECDAHRSEIEYAVATQDFALPWMVFPKGSIAAQWSRWVGSRLGEDIIVAEVIWKMSGPIEPDWPITEGYEIAIAGVPALQVSWRQDLGPQGQGTDGLDYLTGALLATAMAAVNAIPAVCAAPPGLRTGLDLPVMPGQYVGPSR